MPNALDFGAMLNNIINRIEKLANLEEEVLYLTYNLSHI